MKTLLKTSFYFFIFIFIINSLSKLHSEDFWEQLSGPNGGVLSINISPDGILYAIGGGLFKSTNDGNSWELQKIKESLNLNTGLEIDGSGNLYTTSKDEIYNTVFLCISTDKGYSWTFKEFGTQSESIKTIKMTNDSTFYVIMSTYFKKITLRDDGSLLVDIIQPNQGGPYQYSNLYVSNNHNLYASTQNNVFHSSDDGVSWEKLNFDFETNGSLDILLSDNNYIYVISDIGYVWRSTDTGLSFTKINQYGCAIDIYDLAINKNNELLAFSTNGICKSTDYGDNWDYFNENFIFNPIHYSIVKDMNGDLIMGDHNIIYKSSDNGYNWVLSNNGINNVQTNQIKAFNKKNSILTYHKNFDLDIPYYFYNIDCISKEYQTLIPDNYNGSIFLMTIDKNDNIYVTRGTSSSEVFCSTNYGKNWNILENIPTTNIYDFYFGTDGLSLILSNDAGYIYRSTDYGVNWDFAQNGSNNNKIEYVNDELIFVYGYNIGISKSTDKGNTWQKTSYNNTYPARSLVTDNNMNIYVSAGSSLLKSTDFGDNWLQINDTIPVPYPKLLMSNNDVLFAFALSSKQGVSRSTDYGETWEQINSGIEDVSIQDFTIGPDGRIYLSTTRFVFRSKEPVNSVVENIDAVKNEVNVFPNPLSNSGEVKFELEQTGIIEVKIYDILGNPLQTIYKGMKEAGLNKIQFSTEQFSSGVYYIVINSGANKYVDKFMKF